MATAEQLVNKMQRELLDEIDTHLTQIEKQLRKYQPLIEQRDKLTAARRALLNERSTSQNGGRGLSQGEVIKALEGSKGSSVYDLAQALHTTEAVVRGHLNRGRDERFEVFAHEGKKLWKLREPENDEEEDEDDE